MPFKIELKLMNKPLRLNKPRKRRQRPLPEIMLLRLP